MEENAKKGLGIAAVILGGFSILCCTCLGLGLVPAIVGMVFSIICIVKGTGSGKTLGIVGIILNGMGILLGVYILFSLAMMIDWNNVMDPQIWEQLNQIDPNDQNQVRDWMQQFFRMDISYY